MVHEALTSGDMPPKEELQPTEAEKRQILTWIVQQAAQNANEIYGTQRRLNRREFSAALQDLTGLPIDFAVGIPEDAKVDGFDTGATALQDGADSVAQWLEVTRRAVDSIRFLEPIQERVIRIDFRDHEFTDFRKFVEANWGDEGVFTRSKRLTCKKEIGLYLPTQWTGDRGDSFLALPVPKDKSTVLKVSLSVVARRPMPGLPNPMLWVKVGGSYIDYRPINEEPQTLTYAVRMEDCLVEDDVVKIMLRSFVEVPYSVAGFANDDRSKPEDKIPGGIGIYRPAFDRKVLRDPELQPVPTIVIESVEVDYDHRIQWPPTHWNEAIEDRQDNEQYALALLKLWMDRAWRRPVPDDEREKFIALYRYLRGEGLSFDEALRGVFQSVLMGGPFRYLASPSDSDPVVAQHAIASRLSFMLVGSPPDEELRHLAAAGKLRIPSVVDAQVDRLLSDPRSMEFYRCFVTQWLNMDQPITLTMSHFKKQDFKFGRNLKDSMNAETVQYVARLFAENRPAVELVASDWTMMNDILAFHYGVAGVEGAEFRKVILRPDECDPRGGGILGHAGIQSMLCWMGDNWVIYRGAWALNHILDDPPPPPPLEVPELLPFDKQNQGKHFRELLVQHQADSKCNVCHKKIDPLGFAFQNFDLSGRWREVEHDRYHRAELDGKIEWRGQGETRPVDGKGSLPRGEEFADYHEFKQLLAEAYLDDIVKGMLKKLTLYGTGRTANVVDIITIQAIMKEQAEQQYPMRDLLKALIRSKIFCESSTSPSNG
ncbi:DUF1592 domain-containing protein [Bremerella sp. P1]|uniref:DUF1592 domain-containing protein n=1 Tax=Bremerella sp. P1 TaxID=3026424 RepID=UPI002367B2BD|nr:DUF1592 domain-containing protein [Bremerella sp. P1]WDI41502.1 DUF1592 domain-containing protein [Bremerella sp. P1]